MTQWFGGMGVIVLAVAVLPFMGVGGLDLIRAEAPGPDADRLAPRIRGTATRLWLLYVGFTVVSVLALWIVGASLYDAAAHALTVTSTGGLSPFNDSVAGFDSLLIEVILIVLMIYGAMNFALHWRFLTGDRGIYRRSTEVRWYLLMTLAACAIVVGLLSTEGSSIADSARGGIFTVVSLITSTGYANGSVGNFVLWGVAAQLVLLGLMVVGGMSGSTAGGMKTIRFAALARVIGREIKQGIRPRAVLSIRFDGVSMTESVVARMLAFATMYILFVIGGTIAVVGFGAEFDSALGGSASSMGNMGPGDGRGRPRRQLHRRIQPTGPYGAGLADAGRPPGDPAAPARVRPTPPPPASGALQRHADEVNASTSWICPAARMMSPDRTTTSGWACANGTPWPPNGDDGDPEALPGLALRERTADQRRRSRHLDDDEVLLHRNVGQRRAGDEVSHPPTGLGFGQDDVVGPHPFEDLSMGIGQRLRPDVRDADFGKGRRGEDRRLHVVPDADHGVRNVLSAQRREGLRFGAVRGPDLGEQVLVAAHQLVVDVDTEHLVAHVDQLGAKAEPNRPSPMTRTVRWSAPVAERKRSVSCRMSANEESFLREAIAAPSGP